MADEARQARIKKLLAQHGDPLVLHDWYFDDCPNKERRACVYYEYLREALCEDRIKLADWEAGVKYDPVTDHDARRAEQWFTSRTRLERRIRLRADTLDFALGLIRPPWPSKPWLDLQCDDRVRRIGGFFTVEFGASNSRFRQIASVRMQPWEIWGWFKFHKGISVDQLVEYFVAETKRLAAAQRGLFEERDLGKRGWLPRLHKLGARRLRGLKHYFRLRGERFVDEDVIAYAALQLRHETNPFRYRRSSELISAANGAEKVLNNLVPKIRQ